MKFLIVEPSPLPTWAQIFSSVSCLIITMMIIIIIIIIIIIKDEFMPPLCTEIVIDLSAY
jgi:hypothetical protein